MHDQVIVYECVSEPSFEVNGVYSQPLTVSEVIALALLRARLHACSMAVMHFPHSASKLPWHPGSLVNMSLFSSSNSFRGSA